MLGKDRSYRMNGFVPIKSFTHEPRERFARTRRVIQSKLGFNGCVNDGMCLECLRGLMHLAVETLDERDALLFVELKPFLRLRCAIRVVALQVASSPSVPSNGEAERPRVGVYSAQLQAYHGPLQRLLAVI